MNKMPSIFNDVIGPIMRGPSSSHVAAAARIGDILRQSIYENFKKISVEFDVNGSLAESHDGHGTDLGFTCGVLNLSLTDPDVINCFQIAKEKNINIEFLISDYGALHPNFYKITVQNSDDSLFFMDAISTGGGMIEIVNFDKFPISIIGDCYEYLFITDKTHTFSAKAIKEFCKNKNIAYEDIIVSECENETLIEFKTISKYKDITISELSSYLNSKKTYTLTPVLPTLSSSTDSLPFHNIDELLSFSKENDLDFGELSILYESKRGNTTEEDVYNKMKTLVSIFKNSIKEGLEQKFYTDRILQSQAYLIEERKEKLIPSDIINTAIKYITAIMETKSSMGVIIAAPTAGSCGCLPGTLLSVGEVLNKSEDEIIKAFFAAGLIGVFFADQATFAAEVGGCQVECGAGSTMAAAGLCQLMGGSVEEVLSSASFALQGITGLACDPVANRVEVPCLNKNIMGGMNAISSANVILAGYDKVIPLKESIDAVYNIGKELPISLRCTCGGLGKTETSFAIRKTLEEI